MSAKPQPPLPEPILEYRFQGGGGGDWQCFINATARTHGDGYHVTLAAYPVKNHTPKLWAEALRDLARQIERLP